MKLHFPESLYDSCVVTNISILTGWKFSTIRKKIWEQRQKFRYNYLGFRNSVNYSRSTEYAFIPEINAILRSKGIKIKWRNWTGKLIQFARRFQKGTYLVYVTDHITIIKDGKIFDNMNWNFNPDWHMLRWSDVHFYSKLD